MTSAASSTLAVTVDTVAPVVTESLSNDTGMSSADAITSNPTLTGSGDAHALVHFAVDGNPISQTATVDASGVWSFTPTGLADGTHTIVASEIDAAGNTGTASLSFTLDTAAPVVPSIAGFSPDNGTVGDGITDASVLKLTGTAEANSTVKIYDGATLLGSSTANDSGGWDYTTTSLNPGSHSFTATDTDMAGNTSAASSALAVTLTIPVDATSFSYNPKGLALLSGTSEQNSTISLHDSSSGALLGNVTTCSNGNWAFFMVGVSNSVHSYTAIATDNSGNTGSTNVVEGTAGNDSITNTVSNQTFFGNGGSDTFVFSNNFGHDTIADYQASNDVIEFSHSVFSDFASVLDHATQVNTDVVITLDSHNSLTLHDTTISQLASNQFHLV